MPTPVDQFVCKQADIKPNHNQEILHMTYIATWNWPKCKNILKQLTYSVKSLHKKLGSGQVKCRMRNQKNPPVSVYSLHQGWGLMKTMRWGRSSLFIGVAMPKQRLFNFIYETESPWIFSVSHPALYLPTPHFSPEYLFYLKDPSSAPSSFFFPTSWCSFVWKEGITFVAFHFMNIKSKSNNFFFRKWLIHF